VRAGAAQAMGAVGPAQADRDHPRLRASVDQEDGAAPVPLQVVPFRALHEKQPRRVVKQVQRSVHDPRRRAGPDLHRDDLGDAGGARTGRERQHQLTRPGTPARAGGIGGRGAGEQKLELDRRKIRDRIAELREELENVQREADVRRTRRAAPEVQSVALVGYTNAGKSSLMRALTGDEVYVADRLFATLDTTVRVLKPETRPRILVSDTVGFIKRLPHDLVASFRSTLQEAEEAGLLLHVVDAADPAFREQMQLTRSVLDELSAGTQPRMLVLNKADKLSSEQREALAQEFPEAVIVSSRDPADVRALHARIVEHFERDMEEAELTVPFDRQRCVALAHERSRVLEERYDEQGAHLRVRAPAAVLGNLRAELQRGG